MIRLDDTGVPLTSALAAFSSNRDADGSLDADSMLEQLPFRTLIELLPQTDRPAVCSMDLSRAACTHARLRRFVADEVCFSDYGVGRNDRVAILFPNGPELAVAFVAVTKRTSPPSADTVFFIPICRVVGAVVLHERAAQPGQHSAGDQGRARECARKGDHGRGR